MLKLPKNLDIDDTLKEISEIYIKERGADEPMKV
jgi:hypothetical protein